MIKMTSNRFCSILNKSLAKNVDPTYCLNSFSAKGNFEVFVNNADSGESARNELLVIKLFQKSYYKRNGNARF